MSDDNTSEAVQETEVEENAVTGSVEFALEDLGPDELVKEVKKLRRESAKHRTAKQQKDAELEEFRAWKDSQLSELEKAQKKASELEGELTELRREKQQKEAAKAAKLSADVADRIRGNTPEEMLEDAKRLAELFPQGGSSTAAVAGSAGKTPVTGKGSDTDWFRNFLNGK